MTELGLVCIGVLLTLAVLGVLRWIDRDERHRRRSMAAAVLKRHGLCTEQYVASAEIQDKELGEALDEFSGRGYIVLDDKGCVVGALCPQQIKARRYLRVVAQVR